MDLQPLIDSFPSLLGTIVGGLISFFVLRNQLRYDLDKSEREWKLNLKRELYLETVTSLTKAEHFLAAFAKASLDSPNPETLIEIGGAINRAGLVAEKQTLSAIDDFGNLFYDQSLKLQIQVYKVDHLKSTLSGLGEEIRSSQARLDQSGRGATQSASTGTEQGLNAVGQAELTLKLRAELQENLEESARLESLQLEELKTLGSYSAEAVIKAGQATAQIVLAIRAELGFPLDRGWYLKLQESRSAKATAQLNRVYKEIDEITNGL